jgi:hypothetical protein
VKLLSSTVKLLWLHKYTSHNKYYYLDNVMDNISHDAIIYNDTKFEPVFGDNSLLWWLLILFLFIQAMNQDTISTLMFLTVVISQL